MKKKNKEIDENSTINFKIMFSLIYSTKQTILFLSMLILPISSLSNKGFECVLVRRHILNGTSVIKLIKSAV